MKQILAFLLFAALLILPVSADYDPQTDYMSRMMAAAQSGELTVGGEAEACRAEKIAALQLDYPIVRFEELYLLSKIIYAEAGSAWLPMEWKMAVGEVVLNRVASPEFPDTVREVLEQPGQYYGKNSSYFNSLKPSAECVAAAKKLLEGVRVLGEPGVVFQSNYRLGGGVYLEMKDAYLGSTYFCWSNHPELYAA